MAFSHYDTIRIDCYIVLCNSLVIVFMLDFEDEVRRAFSGTMSIINFPTAGICKTWILAFFSNWSQMGGGGAPLILIFVIRVLRLSIGGYNRTLGRSLLCVHSVHVAYLISS